MPKSIIATDSLNNSYTVEDFNSLEKMPNGAKFEDDLVLSHTQINRLPRNLVVSGDLWLSNTTIKEVPSGTAVGRRLLLHDCAVETLPDGLVCYGLHLKNSQVTSLPDELNVKELHLEGSKVKSIGQNITILNCYDDQGRSFNRVLTCKNFVFGSAQEHAIIKNINAVRANLKLATTNNSPLATITINDSDIIKISCNPQSGSKLAVNLLDNVKCETLSNNNVVENSKSQYLLLNIDGATIDNVLLIDSPLVFIEILNLKLRGNFHFGSNASVGSSRLKLPDHGVVFGNVVITEGTKIPPTFCCLGDITFMDPELTW